MVWCLRRSTPTARKAHQCSLCYGPIQKGERYDRQVMIGDDGLYEWLTCPACGPIGPILTGWLVDPYEGWTPDDAEEWARGHVSDAELGALASGYLERRAAAFADWEAQMDALGVQP